LPRIGNLESRILWGLDYKAYKTGISGVGTPIANDVTVRPFSIGYAGAVSDGAAETAFNATIARNIPGGDNGHSADFNNVRAGASSSYAVLRYSASYAYGFASDWQARLVFSGQYTNDALVPGEQFGAGGAASVRGFAEREESRDRGHQVNAEIYTPNLCGAWETTQCRALAFIDAASVRNNRTLPGESARASIASSGIGLRATMSKNMMVQVDYGHVIDAGRTQAKGDGYVHFRVGVAY
jgi:hemolysin activation/secretion protein